MYSVKSFAAEIGYLGKRLEWFGTHLNRQKGLVGVRKSLGTKGTRTVLRSQDTAKSE